MLVLFPSFCQASAAGTIFDLFVRQVAWKEALKPQMHSIKVQAAALGDLPEDFVSTQAKPFTSSRFTLACEPTLFRESLSCRAIRSLLPSKQLFVTLALG